MKVDRGAIRHPLGLLVDGLHAGAPEGVFPRGLKRCAQ